MEYETQRFVANRYGPYESGAATWVVRAAGSNVIVAMINEPQPLPKFMSQSWQSAQREFIADKIEQI